VYQKNIFSRSLAISSFDINYSNLNRQLKPLPMTIMKALITQVKEDEAYLSVEDIPIPTLEENQVLVRVETAAQNPTDGEHLILRHV